MPTHLFVWVARTPEEAVTPLRVTVRATLQGPSPDEVAIVDAARQLGFEYTARSAGETFVNILGSEVAYETLYVNEFTSDRALMSVIVRCPDGTIKCMVKGSDLKMLSRMRADTSAELLKRVHVRTAVYYFHLTSASSRGQRVLAAHTASHRLQDDSIHIAAERHRQTIVRHAHRAGLSGCRCSSPSAACSRQLSPLARRTTCTTSRPRVCARWWWACASWTPTSLTSGRSASAPRTTTSRAARSLWTRHAFAVVFRAASDCLLDSNKSDVVYDPCRCGQAWVLRLRRCTFAV